jgi:glycosyltransferase involved in cell wall biosynthesis
VAFHKAWQFEPIYPCALAHWITRAGQVLFTLSGSEENVLRAMGIGQEITLIPHIVEELPSPSESTPREGPTTKTVVVAGFLVGSKGHELLLEAMPLLPEIEVIFVGGPSPAAHASDRRSHLMELAKRKGVHDRLRVTGYLPEDEYRRYLLTADLAVCPFPGNKSASGSLSSLIAAVCPTLASDIPLIAEYNAIVPGAIPVFRPYTPEALAAAIRQLLETPREALTRGLAELRQRLSISTIYSRHLEAYRRVLVRPSPPGP